MWDMSPVFFQKEFCSRRTCAEAVSEMPSAIANSFFIDSPWFLPVRMVGEYRGNFKFLFSQVFTHPGYSAMFL